MVLAEVGWGTAETGAVLGTAAMLVVGLLAFLGRGVLGDLRSHDRRLSEHDTKLAVIEAAKVHERVEKLEQDMAQIKGDVRVIRAWVDSQTRQDRHRRHDDPKDG